ncbi:POTE ankyrin domain family member C-like [Oxyura jamaicensis]|uniref:POTE ankyrin domain family member C-like n=1 Tax=Oxyura jamaicensis TaxID=8884 RepID=UPI0015A52AA4|nr:POTE ankyrin domain family member C-like [Oxyura jamaicensis]
MASSPPQHAEGLGARQGPMGATVGACRLQERQPGGLHGAAARGDLALLRRRWWLRKLFINWRDAEGRTPLHLACINGHVDVVRFLVRKKCKLNPRDNLKYTPLMKAVACKQEGCVAVLLEHGADPNATDGRGNTALHLAVHTANISVVQNLLQHNAQIDALNQLGLTPLALAVSNRCKKMAEFLLEKRADVNARDCCGSLTEEPVSSETTGESSADGKKGTTVSDNSCSVTTEGVLTAAEAEQEEGGDSCESSSASGIAGGGEMQILRCAKEPGKTEMDTQLAEKTPEDTLLSVSKEEEEGDDSCSDSEGSAKQKENLPEQQDAETKTDFQDNTQGVVRQLPQELPGAPEEQPKSKAPLEDPKRCYDCLKENKRRLQKELDTFKAKLLQSQEQHTQNLNYAVGLQIAIEKMEREVTASCLKQQSLLVASAATVAIKQLEKRVQWLEVQNARLEATVQQQAMIIEALQKDLQASASSPQNWQSQQ